MQTSIADYAVQLGEQGILRGVRGMNALVGDVHAGQVRQYVHDFKILKYDVCQRVPLMGFNNLALYVRARVHEDIRSVQHIELRLSFYVCDLCNKGEDGMVAAHEWTEELRAVEAAAYLVWPAMCNVFEVNERLLIVAYGTLD